MNADAAGLRAVAITGVGAISAVGTGVEALRDAIAAGRTGYKWYPDDLRAALPIPGYAVADVDCTPFLKRKKDKKLLPRAAELALVAAGEAIGTERPPGIGCFVGVGREPSDQVDTGPALLASITDGRLDLDKLGGIGRAMYPPLAPLRTLPNLILAHVAIHLDFTGESGTRAGEEAAGIAAIVEGWLAVAEGRADIVIAGGADCRIDLGSARDLVEQGLCGPTRGPGEGAGMIRMEPLDRAIARGATVLAVVSGGATCGDPPADAMDCRAIEPIVGAPGSAEGPLAIVAALGRSGAVFAVEDSGARAWFGWTTPA